ncbi:hypothetical protein P7266_0662 [Lactococcus cremoris]|nr:hypothetical protein P7266_0662 [Lactococcus cremoris]
MQDLKSANSYSLSFHNVHYITKFNWSNSLNFFDIEKLLTELSVIFISVLSFNTQLYH